MHSHPHMRHTSSMSKKARYPERNVQKNERIKRRQALSALLAGGVPREEMDQLMARDHGMTVHAVSALLSQVVKGWADEELERRPQWKRAAMRRMHGHIAAARGAKNWSAVAQLERLLAQMQGTLEPLEINVNLDATVRESVINVVAMATPERIDQLAALALRLRTAARLPMPSPARVVQAVADAAE